MNPALVLVDHGSRRPEANAALDELAALVRAADPGRCVHVAHMEISPPELESALGACLAEGARNVIVVPVFLGPGRHSQEDIPRLVREARERHPELSVQIAPPLGPHPLLAQLVLARAAEV